MDKDAHAWNRQVVKCNPQNMLVYSPVPHPLAGAAAILTVQAMVITRLHAMYKGVPYITHTLLALYGLTGIIVAIITGLNMHKPEGKSPRYFKHVLSLMNFLETAHPAEGLNVCTPTLKSGFLWAYW